MDIHRASDPKKPYGDVPYADPGYQADGKKRYPIDTEDHCKAAWSYINMSKNAAKYSSQQLAAIKRRIKAALKTYGVDVSDDSKAAPAAGDEQRRPPRDDLFRAVYPGLECRVESDGLPPTLHGHFAVFNQWTEIKSIWEGNFLERIAPGTFKKTFQENRDKIRVLFQHGRDPQIGDKPLGAIEELKEDRKGAAYEVPMLDTAYNREIIPGLKAGLYGASFRFRVLKEDFDHEPGQSDHNPDGLPERTIREADVSEFGPVTFPAYTGATAGVRSVSMTDQFLVQLLAEDEERFAELMEQVTRAREIKTATPQDQANALPGGAEGSLTPDGSRESQPDQMDADGAGEPPTPQAVHKGPVVRPPLLITTSTGAKREMRKP